MTCYTRVGWEVIVGVGNFTKWEAIPIPTYKTPSVKFSVLASLQTPKSLNPAEVIVGVGNFTFEYVLPTSKQDVAEDLRQPHSILCYITL